MAKLQQAALPPSGPNGKFVDENSGAPLVSKTINHSCEPVATSTQEHLSRQLSDFPQNVASASHSKTKASRPSQPNIEGPEA